MQVADVYALMKSWEQDPCWDLENDAYNIKYAPYKQILLDFAKTKREEREEYCKPKNFNLPKATFDRFIGGKGYLLIKRVVFGDGYYNEIYLTPQSTELLVKVNDDGIIEISNCKEIKE